MNLFSEIKNWLKAGAVGAVMLVGVDAMATGPIPINSTQSGTLSFTTNGASPLIITNAFSPGFSYPPVMSFYLTGGSVTNAGPLTNTILTTTNFAVELATPTNATVYWTAVAASPRIETGSQYVLSTTPTNISFAPAYGAAPFVVTEPGYLGLAATNTSIGITNITSTQFQATVSVSQLVTWMSFGSAAVPGPSPNPVSY